MRSLFLPIDDSVRKCALKINTLRVIFGDQLSHWISSLKDLDLQNDKVVMFEVMEENTYVKHHKQKIAFVLSAMRHFAHELQQKNIPIYYVKLNDKNNTQSLEGEIARAIKLFNPKKIIVTEPSEYRVKQKIISWQTLFKCTFEIRSDDRFICSHDEFKRWTQGKQQLRMEFFYREMRRKTGILMTEDQRPEGGEWNYDKNNREPLKKTVTFPDRLSFEPDEILQDVLNLVEKNFSHHIGDLTTFHWAINRAQALKCLDHFIKKILPHFGEYQDAMKLGEAYLFHSVLAPYINVGLLLPLEVCQKAESAYKAGVVPLNSAEGFIRQILGWREYVRGIYWLEMPDYEKRNYFNASHPLPKFYWDAKTDLNCLREVISQTIQHAYSHHIQRLMITGNFALLAGLNPIEVCEWYLIVYADAFDWVELPNTLGMSLFGDGGLLASKPYAASGNYIHRMSNFCQTCAYDPKQTVGEKACPFNYLFWNFIAQHEKTLQQNQRLTYVYANWRKMEKTKKEHILRQAKQFIDALK